MKTIWKHVIEPNSKRNEPYPCVFEAPAGAKPISVGLQNGVVCVWYECDPGMPKLKTAIYCVGTGFGSVPNMAKFLGTVIDGSYVWHFYTQENQR